MHQPDTCYGQWHPYHDHGTGDALMALTIGLTMACTVIIAKVVGCTLPLVAKKVGLDPAIMATPLISTLVDISTISVYFAIVSYVFGLNIKYNSYYKYVHCTNITWKRPCGQGLFAL